MTSPLLSHPSSDSCFSLLSSFASSESSSDDPLAGLIPSFNPDELHSSNVPLLENEAVIPDLPAPAFLCPEVKSSLDVLPLELIGCITPPSDQFIDVGNTPASNSNDLCSVDVSCCVHVGPSELDVRMACGDLSVVQEPRLLTDSKLGAPTMHPNLVSTLKSLICPSNEQELNLCAQESVLEMAAPASICSMPNLCAQENILEIAASATICSMPASDLATPQPSSPYPLSVSTGSTVGFVENPVIVPKIERKQSQHAAIVPIYLIQNRRPYRCSYRDCSKTFKNPQTLKMHLKTHYGGGGSVAVNGGYNRTKLMQPLSTVPQSCKAGKNKKIPSRCPICKRAFVGLYELRRHFGRKHSEGEKAHACRKCGKRFYIEVDLRDHQKQCGEPLVCKCGMKFAFKCNLVAHKKTHPLCQDEHERQKYQQRKQTQKSQISKAQKITLGMQHGQSKDVSFPSNTGSGKGVPPMIEAVCASNEAYRSCDSTPHWSSSSSRIFHPIVKTEYSTCNQWISPPVLGVSRAL